jgi:dTMP kinase
VFSDIYSFGGWLGWFWLEEVIEGHILTYHPFNRKSLKSVIVRKGGLHLLGMQPGKMIVIEGLDGAGKSTLSRSLAIRLAKAYPLARYAEPGGTPLGERLRALIKDPDSHMLARSEALLFAAARAELADKIRKDLAEGTWVLLDRWVPSSVAYQGWGREIGAEGISLINDWATEGLTPDLVLYLKISPASSRSRIQKRGLAKDRIELEDGGFFSRAAQGYEQWVDDNDYAHALDAKLSPDQLAQQAWELVRELER